MATLLGLPACRQGESKLASERVEGLANAPALRTDARDIVDRGCRKGDAPVRDNLITRRPYLQPVNETTLKILWTTKVQASAFVAITHEPTGQKLVIPASEDQNARPVLGAALFTATVEGLEPQTLYCYDVIIEGQLAARAGFRTAPAADSNTPTDVLVFGDSGDGSVNQAAVFDQMSTVPIDLMIHVGDIAYESGTRLEFERKFFSVYADLLEQFPFLPASGNHEYETEEARPFREVFALPENGGEAGLERWYSYDWGNAHFVALDTEKIGPVQAAWLDADLAASQRPWNIVYGHRPPHSSGSHRGDANFRTHFVPVLERHGVPLVLGGHDHHYERTAPINGVTYIVTGGGGRFLRPVARGPEAAYVEAVLHFVTLSISRDKLQVHAIDATGVEFDNVVIEPKQADHSEG